MKMNVDDLEKLERIKKELAELYKSACDSKEEVLFFHCISYYVAYVNRVPVLRSAILDLEQKQKTAILKIEKIRKSNGAGASDLEARYHSNLNTTNWGAWYLLKIVYCYIQGTSIKNLGLNNCVYDGLTFIMMAFEFDGISKRDARQIGYIAEKDFRVYLGRVHYYLTDEINKMETEQNQDKVIFKYPILSCGKIIYKPRQPILCLLEKAWEMRCVVSINNNPESSQKGTEFGAIIWGEECRINSQTGPGPKKAIVSFNTAMRKRKIPTKMELIQRKIRITVDYTNSED